MQTQTLSRRSAIVLLLTTGFTGFVVVVLRTLAQSETQTIQVDVPFSAITQTGLLILSALLLITGSYLTGYRRGSRTGNRITMDFSKESNSKSNA